MNGTLFLLAVSTLAACGGTDKGATSDTGAAAPASGPAVGSTAVTTSPVTLATSAPGAAAAVTGKMTDVKMVGDAKGYRFEPANFTVKVGDGARFTNVSGGPHDVTFWPDSIPAGMAACPLNRVNSKPNQTYVVSFAGLKPGVYHYYCTPHLALGMKGTITVQ